MKNLTMQFLSILILLSPLCAGESQQFMVFPWEDVESINSAWEYFEPEDFEGLQNYHTPYRQIDLPHTWNDLDALDPEVGENYRRDAAWYRKEITFNDKEITDVRKYIRFGGAGQVAEVYFNEHFLGRHVGGYTAFTYEITPYLDDDNILAVKVDNSWDEMVAPLSGDFTKYGGLYRPVQIITSPMLCLSRKHLSGPGIRVWSPSVNEKSAELQAEITIDNGYSQSQEIHLLAELYSPQGKLVTTAERSAEYEGNEVGHVELEFPDVKDPKLWSPEHPNLYQLRVKLIQEEEIIDEAVVNHGFRWFRFDPDDGFFLNGKPYTLRGVNRHQDYHKKGNALSYGQHREDLRMIKELGANFLRLAHYPQSEYVLQLCDQLGLLVWEEIPLVNDMTFKDEFYQNTEKQLYEMIEQHFNHPSIVLWGIGNELLLGEYHKGEPMIPFLERLNEIIHTEDPGRKSVIACHKSDDYISSGIASVPDVVGFNLYYGWYYHDVADLTPGLERFHKMLPSKPLIVSEYGCGSDTSRHSPYPGKFDFTEEYQVYFNTSYLQQFEQLDFLSGTALWNMFDFGSAGRGNSIPGVNQKGLLTFNRKKKDTYYLFKSYWKDEPVVHIQSSHWKSRRGKPEKQYRVISNCDEVELYHQGESLGRQSDDFTWDVQLQEGENILRAVGTKETERELHKITVNFDPGPFLERKAIRVNCGGTAYTDTRGNVWEADQTLVEVEAPWGAISGEKDFDEDATIAGTDDADLFRYYRSESGGYHFDLPQGRYRVRLGLFKQPSQDESNRTFDIVIQDELVTDDWTFLNSADLREAIWREFQAEVVQDEGLTIRFNDMARHSHSLICAIEIIPK